MLSTAPKRSSLQEFGFANDNSGLGTMHGAQLVRPGGFLRFGMRGGGHADTVVYTHTVHCSYICTDMHSAYRETGLE